MEMRTERPLAHAPSKSHSFELDQKMHNNMHMLKRHGKNNINLLDHNYESQQNKCTCQSKQPFLKLVCDI